MDYQQWFNLVQEYLKNPNDIQKNLDSLKQVQHWLEINTNMVKNTIEYLEFYKNMSNFNFNNNINQGFDTMSKQWLAQLQKMQSMWNINTPNSFKESNEDKQE